MIKSVKLITGLSTTLQKLSLSTTSYCCRRFNRLDKFSGHNNFVSDDPNERQFTFAQMKQIKHMYYESPDTWNYNNLAAHFGTDYQTIRRIVKKKHVPGIEAQRDLDARVLGAERVRSLEENLAAAGYHKKEVAPIDLNAETHSTQSTGTVNNKWFQNYTNSPREGSTKPKYDSIEEFTNMEDYLPDQDQEVDEIFDQDDHNELFLVDHSDMVDIEEEEEEIYRQIEEYEQEENPDEEVVDEGSEDSDVGTTQAFRVVTDDGVNFYDEQGRFLYKIA